MAWASTPSTPDHGRCHAAAGARTSSTKAQATCTKATPSACRRAASAPSLEVGPRTPRASRRAPDLGEWVDVFRRLIQPSASHLCVLRQASTRTRATTAPPVSLSRPIITHTQASSRRRSRTASPSPTEGLLWARRGTAARASGSAAAASLPPAKKPAPKKKDVVPLTTAEKAAVLHAIAQLDGKATQKKVRRAAESILGAPRFVDAKKAAVEGRREEGRGWRNPNAGMLAAPLSIPALGDECRGFLTFLCLRVAAQAQARRRYAGSPPRPLPPGPLASGELSIMAGVSWLYPETTARAASSPGEGANAARASVLRLLSYRRIVGGGCSVSTRRGLLGGRATRALCGFRHRGDNPRARREKLFSNRPFLGPSDRFFSGASAIGSRPSLRPL